MYKIVVVTPDRGDRPELLKMCKHMVSKQTTQRLYHLVIDAAPKTADKDITYRYRLGCSKALEIGCDIIMLMENDDWYSEFYIQTMINEWEKAGQPEIFGIGETYYYHLGLRSWYHQKHVERASAFCTMITAEGISKMKWPNDNYSFTDIEFWKQLKGKTFVPEKLIALGIKGHNSSAYVGGIGHNDKWGGYKEKDNDLCWLKANVNNEAFEFYKKISKNAN